MSFLYQSILTKLPKIRSFLNKRLIESSKSIYSSIDIRFAGYKIAPVDINCFPAGFTNLSKEGQHNLVNHISNFIKDNKKKDLTERVMIISESHTRNQPYIDGLFVLKSAIEHAGYEVEIAALNIGDIEIEQSKTGKKTVMHRLHIRDGYLTTSKNFRPDFVILNDDLSKELHPILRNVRQPIFPNVKMGWYNRLKSTIFNIYSDLNLEMCKKLDLDPWLFDSFHDRQIDFNIKSEESRKELKDKVEKIFTKIEERYKYYNIKDEPRVFIKSNKGTYGLGIIVVSSPKDVLTLNKKARKTMSTVKHGTEINDLLIQEGVATITKAKGHYAEPVIYSSNNEVCEVFYRFHNAKGNLENLNSVGASFANTIDCQDTQEQFQELLTIPHILSTIALSKEVAVFSFSI